jgi:hypothetical protein
MNNKNKFSLMSFFAVLGALLFSLRILDLMANKVDVIALRSILALAALQIALCSAMTIEFANLKSEKRNKFSFFEQVQIFAPVFIVLVSLIISFITLK